MNFCGAGYIFFSRGCLTSVSTRTTIVLSFLYADNHAGHYSAFMMFQELAFQAFTFFHSVQWKYVQFASAFPLISDVFSRAAAACLETGAHQLFASSESFSRVPQRSFLSTALRRDALFSFFGCSHQKPSLTTTNRLDSAIYGLLV